MVALVSWELAFRKISATIELLDRKQSPCLKNFRIASGDLYLFS